MFWYQLFISNCLFVCLFLVTQPPETVGLWCIHSNLKKVKTLTIHILGYSPHLNMTMECRSWFDNGKMTQSMRKGYSRCSGTSTSALASIQLEECKRYKNLLLKK